IQYPRNDLAPYFFEEIRKYLEEKYGTAAVHERGLRVYTTLNVHMQQAANQAVRDGLHAYERHHGWKGNLPNVVRDNLGKLDTYEDEDWRHAIEKGSYVTGLVLSVNDRDALIKIGPYRAIQALRQVGSSFKIYVYADALEKGASPFDTIVDAPFTTISGGQPYTPHNYDEKFEGTITLRRALAGSRNVPAVKLAEKEGIN